MSTEEAKQAIASEIDSLERDFRDLHSRVQLTSLRDQVEDFENRAGITSIISNAMKVGVDTRKLGTDLLGGSQSRILHRLRYGLESDKISTGIKRLDWFMNGGLDRGELGIIMAPPKGFKTGTLVHLAVAALTQRLKVLIYTMEVSEDKYTMRVERRLAGLDRQEIITKDEQLSKALKRIGTLKGGMYIKGYPMKSVTVENLRNHIEFLSSEGFRTSQILLSVITLSLG